MTPLAVSALTGRFNICGYLIKRGARINTGSRKVGPPLYAAAGNNHTKILDLLLNNGAEIEQSNSPDSPNGSVTFFKGDLESGGIRKSAT